MKDLERVDSRNGGYACRGWLKRKKRHGLWIEEAPGKFTITIYDEGVEQAQQVILANDPAPFPITALFDRLKATQRARDEHAASAKARKK
jgi:hypothetical protein